ncbi:MAG: hypothetical protein HYX88_01035 [Chloroflexi bacterium]|nr:hypothetical protein [Chloroflexota bacterium]
MITPPVVVNTIVKQSLVKDLGVALSTLIILQCGKKCNVTIFNLDREGYVALVASIATDYRVAKTLGHSEALLRMKAWLRAIE